MNKGNLFIYIYLNKQMRLKTIIFRKCSNYTIIQTNIEQFRYVTKINTSRVQKIGQAGYILTRVQFSQFVFSVSRQECSSLCFRRSLPPSAG